MTRRDMDATDRTLYDFISGHSMHLCLVSTYRTHQNMIGIVAVGRTLDSVDSILFSAERTVCFHFLATYDIL
jgi:sensor histidine kinase regulating citrate/malate metabolism